MALSQDDLSWYSDPNLGAQDSPVANDWKKAALWICLSCVLSILAWGFAVTSLVSSQALDNAADATASFGAQFQKEFEGPKEKFVATVNSGQLSIRSAEEPLRRHAPQIAKKVIPMWEKQRSNSLMNVHDEAAATEFKQVLDAASIEILDAAAKKRVVSFLSALFGLATAILGAFFALTALRRRSDSMTIEKVVVLSRASGATQTVRTGGDEYIANMGLKHFESTFSRLPVACCSFSSDGKITAWNDAMEQTSGLESSDALQQSFWEVMQWQQLGELGQNFIYKLLRGESVDSVDWGYHHPAGERLELRAKLIPIVGATGSVISAIAAVSDVTLQRRQERMLVENDLTKTAMLSSIPDTLMRIDMRGKLADLRDNAGLFDVEPSTLIGESNWPAVVGEPLAQMIMSAVRTRRHQGGYSTFEYHSGEGERERHIEIRVAPCGGSDALAILHDITDRYRAETAVKHSENRLRYLVEGSADLLMLVDQFGRIKYQSPAIQGILGIAETDHLGEPLTLYLTAPDQPMVTATISQLASTPDGKSRFYVQAKRSDGQIRDLEVYARNLLENPYVNAIVLNIRDVTERRGLERELQRRVEEAQQANEKLGEVNKTLAKMATTDGLTGLRNHRSSQEYLSAAVRHMQKSGKPTSLAIIDVDFFKKINDTYGHQEGDRVLQWLATVVQKSCRHLHLAGRYGGEEFVLVMPETDADTAYAEVEALRQRVEASEGLNFKVTISIGLVTSTSCESADELFNSADRCLYASKQGGRNRTTCVIDDKSKVA